MARAGIALVAGGGLLVLPCLCFCFLLSAAGAGAARRYEAMFNFGDSLGDTGNICVNKSAADQLLLTFANPPYGMTYFGHPTCRCSDGRLVVDFLAQGLGLPLLQPSKRRGLDFRKGANLAIVGATALDFEFLKSIGLGYQLWNNGAMNLQIQWLRDLLPPICGAPKGQACRAYLAKSLFVFGPFGGNDYNAMFVLRLHPRPGAQLHSQDRRHHRQRPRDGHAPCMQQLIQLGAVDIVVPGALPIGCFAVYLTFLPSSNPGDYDEHGCLKPLNALSLYQNSLLQSRLAGLRARHPSVRIMYADYYAHVEQMVRSPARFGFSCGAVPACCGAGGGKFNYEFDARCGMKGATACRDPSSHQSWDGIHFTEAVNRLIADGWLRGPYCRPPIPLH